MAKSAAEREQLEYEGFGPDDPESGRARGKPRPRAGTSKDPAVGPATRRDELALRRQARQREGEQRRQIESEEAPPTRASARRSSPGSSRRTYGLGQGAPSTSSGFDAGDAGGFLLVALFLWPIGINLLRGGPAQATAWLAAKFVNKPAAASSGTGSFGPPPSGGGQVGQLPGGAGGIVPPGASVGNPGQNYINTAAH